MNLGPFIDWRVIRRDLALFLLVTLAIVACVLVAFLSPLGRERIDTLSGGPYVVQSADGRYLGWTSNITEAKLYDTFARADSEREEHGGQVFPVREVVR